MFEGLSRLPESAILELEAQNASRRRRIPRIDKFYDILETVAWTWRVIGVFPFTIKDQIAGRRYVLNKYHAFYSFLVFAFCCDSFIYEVLAFNNSLNNDETIRITKILYLYRAFMGMMYSAISNIWRVIRQRELLETIEKMREQHIILERMNCLNHESNIKIIRAFVWTMFASTLILISWNMYNGIRREKNPILPVLWIIPQAVRINDLMIFLTLVGLVGMKFRASNEKLKSIVKRANGLSPEVILTSEICAENVRLVSRAHFHLCTIGKRINSIFDWAVIFNVVMAFLVSSPTLYYIFYEVERDGETNYGEIFIDIRTEFTYSVPIIVIVVVCNWTSHQRMYAGKLIHQLRIAKKDQLYAEVKSFSLQLHHQKLKFNASGFFPLNSTLLRTVLATLTSHLVILIQFHPKLD